MERLPKCYSLLEDDNIPGAAVFRVMGAGCRIRWAVGEHTTDVLRFGSDQYVIVDRESPYVHGAVYNRRTAACISRASVCLFFAKMRRCAARRRVRSAYDFVFVLPATVAKMALKHPEPSPSGLEAAMLRLIDGGMVVLPKTDRALMLSLFDAAKHKHPTGFLEDDVARTFFGLMVRDSHYPELRGGVLVVTDQLCAHFAQRVTVVLARVLASWREQVWRCNDVSTASGVHTYDARSRGFVNGAEPEAARGRVFKRHLDLSSDEKDLLHDVYRNGLAEQASKRRHALMSQRKLVPCLQRALSADPAVKLDNRGRMQMATMLGMYSRLCGTAIRDIDHTGYLRNPHSSRRRISHYFIHVDKNESGAYRYKAPSCASMQRADSGIQCAAGCSPSVCCLLNNTRLPPDARATPITVMFGDV